MSGGGDRTLRLWSAADGREPRRADVEHTAAVYALALAADGRLALAGGDHPAASLWDAPAGKLLRRFEPRPGQVFAVAFSRDGRRALTGTAEGAVYLWDVATGRELHRWERLGAAVYCVTFSGDGRHVFVAGMDQPLRLWRLPNPLAP